MKVLLRQTHMKTNSLCKNKTIERHPNIRCTSCMSKRHDMYVKTICNLQSKDVLHNGLLLYCVKYDFDKIFLSFKKTVLLWSKNI
jgi:hypothetical protein